MRYILLDSRHGGGRALVCGIVGRVHLPWVVLLLVLGRIWMAKWRVRMRHMCGVGDSYGRSLVADSSVTLVLNTSCSTGTFVY